MFSVPGYRVTEEIHHGPLTVVFRGVRESDQAPVVLKTVRAETPTPEQFSRWSHEHEVLRRLDGPGIPRAYELLVAHDRPVLVMEDLGGRSLREHAAGRRIVASEFLALAPRIVAALADVHGGGVIHKDLKPANLVVSGDGARVQVIDFSIASRLSRQSAPAEASPVVEGTLSYVSPEQTGRINRAMDARTDLYSLGVTFYELLTGQLPFRGNDRMELVHAHIARRPVPPHEVTPEVPRVLSRIVVKLLAKTAEERYQSCAGLAADLARCALAADDLAEVADLALGAADVPDRLRIPQKLYGRAPEIRTLLEAWGRVAEGARELLLVSGYSGIGKSALVHEVHKPIAEKRGFFLAGKFDQYLKGRPYHALIQALGELARQILTMDEALVASWREKIAAAVQPNGRVLTDLVPGMERLLGEQPPVPELSPAETQNRFQLVLRNFARAVARREHPVALVLDDLQWADLPTLDVLELLVADAEQQHLLVIGTYRDNQVDAAHPLLVAVEHLLQRGAAIGRIGLRALTEEDLTELVADTLSCEPARAAGLARFLLERTAGNPFFVGQVMGALHEHGAIRLDPEERAWRWDLDAILAVGVTDNLAEMMAAKIETLAPPCREALRLAAAVGHRFDLRTLSVVLGRGLLETADDLGEAIEAGLVRPVGGGHKVLAGMRLYRDLDVGAADFSYAFVHDQIQRAAYSLVAEDRRQEVHLTIARLLLRNIPEAEREPRVFEIVSHLNLGGALLSDAAEEELRLRLNLLAGKKARLAAAYPSALSYFQTALGLLGEDAWTARYELALEVHCETAEAAFRSADFGLLDRLMGVVFERARTLLDKVRVYDVKMQSLIAQRRLPDSLRTGLDVLALFGIHFPAKPGTPDVMEALQATAEAVPADVESMALGPQMIDPEKLAAMSILTSVFSAVYLGAPRLLPLVVSKLVQLSARHGNAPTSAFAFAVYGLILCGAAFDVETGYRFGKLALELQGRSGDPRQRCRVMHVAYTFTTPWKEHARATLKPLLETYQIGLDTGDFEYGAYAAIVHSYYALSVGRELSALDETMSAFELALRRVGKEVKHFLIWHQTVDNLRGRAPDPAALVGARYDVREMRSGHEKTNDRIGLFFVYYNKMMLEHLFGAHEEAARTAVLVEQHLDAAVAVFIVATFHLHDSLIRLALFDRATEEERAAILERVEQNQVKLRKWADHAPMNHRHKAALVDAELARVRGHEAEAMRLYDRAIDGAAAHRYLHEEALGYELAAGFYAQAGLVRSARHYAAQACSRYARWGATAKVKDVEGRFAGLLAAPVSHTEVTSTSIAEEALDLDTVLKASQAISKEIVLSSLVASLVEVAMENAGADRGVLLVRDPQGALGIFAERAVNVVEKIRLDPRPLEAAGDDGAPLVPAGIVNEVARTLEPVVLGAAEIATRSASDAYLAVRRPQSVLCVPLVQQAELAGVLYLENTLTRDAFTPGRLKVLRLLSAQAAISIRNAQLYRNLQDAGAELQRTQAILERYSRTLEEQVKERTRAAEQAQQIAESANQAKSRFLSHMSHEIRTPLTALLGFADLLLDPKIGESDRLNYALTLRRNGNHLLALIDDILDLSKIESGHLGLERIACSPGQILADVAGLMRVRGAAKGLDFEATVATPIPASVLGDPTRLRQILLNLVGNAVKFTDRGSVRLSARYARGLVSPMLVVDVGDTGIGMNDEQMGRLFQPFEQTDLTMRRRFGGTGLGLAICKRLATAMGGDITVESAIGVGSTFTLWLPVQVAEGVALVTVLPEARADRDEVTVHRTLSGRILVAEDGLDNQLLINTILGRHGLTVSIAENGQVAVDRALAALRSGAPYHVILMDMQMPVLDGYSATRRLRDEGYRGPIVALTAHALSEERERCLAAGCDDYIRKPIDTGALISSLAAHIEGGPPPGPPAAEAPIDDTRAALRADAPAAGAAGPGSSPPGLDIPDVLRMVGGDMPAVRRMLAGFAERQRDAGRDIRRAVDAGDERGARELVHALIGVAGNLRVRAVHARALDLQAEIKRRDARAAAVALDRLDEALAEAIRSIASFTAKEAAPPRPRPGPGAEPAERAAVQATLDELEGFLRNNSFDAGSAFERLRRELDGRGLDDLEAELGAQIDRLDYPQALSTLGALRGRIAGGGVSAGTGRPIVLVADDVVENVAALAAILRADYEVRFTTRGAEVLDLALSARPDLILLDVMMPDLDGHAVCRRLKAEPATAGIPVIFITARSDESDEEAGLAAGAADFIAKPVHAAVVRARVRTHVDLKRKTETLARLEPGE
jgi:predicted ATPase/signal transduction histidine kinase/CheY-like chemotaxis protein/HPt (histidine-containing phosphotransfer) domain-containing protein